MLKPYNFSAQAFSFLEVSQYISYIVLLLSCIIENLYWQNKFIIIIIIKFLMVIENISNHKMLFHTLCSIAF